MNKLKFCVFLPFHMLQAKGIPPIERFSKIRDIVLECEKLGYHSVWLDDHLMYNDWPILECWSTLSALASLTSKIRLGSMVSCTSHRSPALLAKVAATVDVISTGRLELGIGAGIQAHEHLAYGLGFPSYNIRVRQLAEAIEIIRLLWTENKANFEGDYYGLKEAICEPKPIQKPHPPITVGGCSELLLSKVTAPYADRFDWGFLPSIQAYQHKLESLARECKIIKRDFENIEKSCWPSGQVLIAENEKELTEKITKNKPANVSLAEFHSSTLAVTPDQCRERIQAYRRLGVSMFMLYFADFPNTTGLGLFAKTVMKKMTS